MKALPRVGGVLRLSCDAISYNCCCYVLLAGLKMNKLILPVLFAVLYQVHTLPLHTEEGNIFKPAFDSVFLYVRRCVVLSLSFDFGAYSLQYKCITRPLRCLIQHLKYILWSKMQIIN